MCCFSQRSVSEGVWQTPQVFCRENLWQGSKRLERPSGISQWLFLLVFTAGGGSHFHLKTVSDHLVVSGGAGAAQCRSFRGSSFPPPPLGSAAKAHPAPAGPFFKPLCPELVAFGLRADLVSPGFLRQKSFFILYWVIKLRTDILLLVKMHPMSQLHYLESPAFRMSIFIPFQTGLRTRVPLTPTQHSQPGVCGFCFALWAGKYLPQLLAEFSIFLVALFFLKTQKCGKNDIYSWHSYKPAKTWVSNFVLEQQRGCSVHLRNQQYLPWKWSVMSI